MKENISKGKTTAIIAHITLVGCLIAITMNLEPKNAFARFYIRQTFGLHIIFHGLVIILNQSLTPFVWEFVFLLYLGLIIYSVMGATKSKENKIPVLGTYFQKWFTFIQ